MTGTLEVTTVTRGVEADLDGYTLLLAEIGGYAIASTGTLSLPEIPAGSHTVRLEALAHNCTVVGEHPRSVGLIGGEITRLAFAVTCSPTTGSVTVRVTTTGSPPDPGGYIARLNGAEPGRLLAGTDQATFSGVPVGDHTVSLTGFEPSCRATEGESRPVTVAAGVESELVFEIICPPLTGELEVSASTSGTQPDPDGYGISVDDGGPQLLGINGMLTVPDLLPGIHAVKLTDVSTQCRTEGENPKSVTIAGGQLAVVRFVVDCPPEPERHAGIVFGTMYLENALLDSVQTGALRVLSPDNILRELSGARTKKARFVVKLIGAGDSHVKNPDGTFSYEKWTALMDKFKAIDFSSYVDDGTILGHYVIDEPDVTTRWGGKVIPQATVESMAKYSKQLWPGMTTMVRALPSWLAKDPVTYTHLDAGWAQYTARRGNTAEWLSGEVGVAERLGLRMMVSMNVLNGGNGSSGIPGTSSRFSSMSAAELRAYGAALLSHPYVCGFLMWKYDAGYYGRADIQAAMTDLSKLARDHARTSCH
jgi:hypothetical protein